MANSDAGADVGHMDGFYSADGDVDPQYITAHLAYKVHGPVLLYFRSAFVMIGKDLKKEAFQ